MLYGCRFTLYKIINNDGSKSKVESALNEIEWTSDAVKALQMAVNTGKYLSSCETQSGQVTLYMKTYGQYYNIII